MYVCLRICLCACVFSFRRPLADVHRDMQDDSALASLEHTTGGVEVYPGRRAELEMPARPSSAPPSTHESEKYLTESVSVAANARRDAAGAFENEGAEFAALVRQVIYARQSEEKVCDMLCVWAVSWLEHLKQGTYACT
jgi:hypothetical protein